MLETMAKSTKTQMIAKPDWMINTSIRATLDVEQQLYIALALEQKFEAAAKKKDLTKFYEIVFHFLNINTLSTDNKLYDTHFKEINGNEHLATFVQDLCNDKEGNAATIIKQIGEVYTRIMSTYMKLAIETMADIDVTYMDEKNMHYYNSEVFVLFNVKPHEHYELWKISFNVNSTTGSSMSKLETFSGMKKGETSDFKEYVKAYNRKSMTNRIHSGNFCVAVSEGAKDSRSVTSVIKDIILLNKIFYDKSQFNKNVLKDMLQVIIEKKTFPFKLMLQ